MRMRMIRIIDKNDSQLQVLFLRKIEFSPKTYSKDQRYDPKYKFLFKKHFLFMDFVRI